MASWRSPEVATPTVPFAEREARLKAYMAASMKSQRIEREQAELDARRENGE